MTVATQVILFPCNGNAREALECLPESVRVLCFIDDNPEKQASCFAGHKVFGRDALRTYGDAAVLAVPGSPDTYRMRLGVIDSLCVEPSRMLTVVHPSAVVSKEATIGTNVLVMAGVVITSNAVIGNNVCILPNTVIHHDAVVGEGSLLGSNIAVAGGVEIGAACYIGSGSSIRNGVRIGEGALIGLGSTVIRDVQANTVVAGNPARQIR